MMPPALHTGIAALFTLLWVGALLLVAGMAVLRLRTTMSGILLTGGFALWAAKLAVLFVASTFLPQLFDDPMPYFMVQGITSQLLSLIIILIVGAGVAFIPKSLAKLQKR